MTGRSIIKHTPRYSPKRGEGQVTGQLMILFYLIALIVIVGIVVFVIKRVLSL